MGRDTLHRIRQWRWRWRRRDERRFEGFRIRALWCLRYVLDSLKWGMMVLCFFKALDVRVSEGLTHWAQGCFSWEESALFRGQLSATDRPTHLAHSSLSATRPYNQVSSYKQRFLSQESYFSVSQNNSTRLDLRYRDTNALTTWSKKESIKFTSFAKYIYFCALVEIYFKKKIGYRKRILIGYHRRSRYYRFLVWKCTETRCKVLGFCDKNRWLYVYSYAPN